MGYPLWQTGIWDLNWKKEREVKPTNSTQRILQFQLKHYIGAKASSTPITIFIDSDTSAPRQDIVTNLLNGMPGPNRIVKGIFERTHQPGPITDILVKPILELTCHPGRKLVQPLSGLLACSSSWISSLTLPEDFGVDLDIVLTAFASNIEVVEVDVVALHAQPPPML